MKCKRCLAQVPDDVDACPNCGQDLTSLRQLLKNFFEGDLSQPEDQGPQPSKPEDAPASPKKDGQKFLKDLRLTSVFDRAEYGQGFSLEGALSAEKTRGEKDQPSPWEGARRGGFWLRLVAFAIDHLILLLTLTIFVALGFLALEMGMGESRGISSLKQAGLILSPLLPLIVVLPLAYFSFFHGAWGQTIGKMIVGLRVVQADGQPLTFSRALVRALAYSISAVPVFLGFLWVGFTSNKRSWHDAISGTIVVRD